MIEYGSIARTIGYSLLFIVIGTVMIWIVGGQWERIMGDFNDTTSLQRIHASVRQLARNKNYIAVFVLLLNVCGIAPTVEELVFRSGLYRILKGRFSTLPAAGISSALFATYHVSVSEFVPLLLFGYLCCWAYEKTGDIRGPIFFHAGFNILGFLTTI
jgi:membrane protease YdiL (CAAX protease family)